MKKKGQQVRKTTTTVKKADAKAKGLKVRNTGFKAGYDTPDEYFPTRRV